MQSQIRNGVYMLAIDRTEYSCNHRNFFSQDSSCNRNHVILGRKSES